MASFLSDNVTTENDINRDYSLSTQMKECGHLCYPSSTSLCCPCSDLRPVLDGDFYPRYLDGEGWTDDAPRNLYYCHVCNQKNYSEWERKILQEREQKAIKQRNLEEKARQDAIQREQDKLRAASCTLTNSNQIFKYTNGDEYEGQMHNGLRHGYGKMSFISDSSIYEGEWVDDRMEGRGIRNWGDGIVYVGQWKNDMMHGAGHYTMVDGQVFEGMFEEDIFIA